MNERRDAFVAEVLAMLPPNINEAQAMSAVRIAYMKGYCDALKEKPATDPRIAA